MSDKTIRPNMQPRNLEREATPIMADLETMTLKQLQEVAVERAIKVSGTGWSTCCPPSGKKDDILAALRRRLSQQQPESEPESPGMEAREEAEVADQYGSMTVVELKAEAERQGVKQAGVGWPTCCPPDGNKADIIAALKKKTEPAATPSSPGAPGTAPTTPPRQVRPTGAPGRSPPFTGPRDPAAAEHGDAPAYRPQTTCGRATTAEHALTDPATAALLGQGLKLPPHVPLICTSFRSSNLRDVDGRVDFWRFLQTNLRCSEEQARTYASNVNSWRASWSMSPIQTMLDYSRWYVDEHTLALCLSSMPDSEEGRSAAEPSERAMQVAAKVMEEVGVADPWSVCDYLRERAAWTYDSIFIDAEAYGAQHAARSSRELSPPNYESCRTAELHAAALSSAWHLAFFIRHVFTLARRLHLGAKKVRSDADVCVARLVPQQVVHEGVVPRFQRDGCRHAEALHRAAGCAACHGLSHRHGVIAQDRG
jgi:hypothetical protein